ncbi:MAG: hypothetical protein N2645_22195 [Clostridia bacterium]|nr:hypothetical protein [Clostridia bacterium]
MLIIGTFEHSIELEQALAELEHSGILRSHILVVPMDIYPITSDRFMNKSNDFYNKGIEVGMACATACSVVGVSIGFILSLGPIFWGLATAFTAFMIGFGLYCLFNKNTHRHLPKKLPEVTVVVQCQANQSIPVEEIMWKYRVLTVGRVLESL